MNVEEILGDFERRFRNYVIASLEQDIMNNLGNIKNRATVNIDVKLEVSDDTIKEIKTVFENMFFSDAIATQQALKKQVARIIRTIEDRNKWNQKRLVEKIALLEEYGFKPRRDGTLFREEPIYLEKVSDGSLTFELPEEMKGQYYVEKIVVEVYPFRITANGRHPHLFAEGNYCTGEIKNFDEFARPEALESIFTVAYIYSFANSACDEIKDFFREKKKELEDQRGWW